MPFNLFRKRDREGAAGPSPADSAGAEQGIPFEALTEDWRLVGRFAVDGRLSDVLNRREAIPLADVQWAPLDASAPLTDAPGLKTVDPYDLIAVFAGAGSLPTRDEDHRVAMRVRKFPYDVELDLGTVHVVGRVYLYPASDPQSLLDRQAELFLPVTRATALHDGTPLGPQEAEVVLVNRSYLKSVEQLEAQPSDADDGEDQES